MPNKILVPHSKYIHKNMNQSKLFYVTQKYRTQQNHTHFHQPFAFHSVEMINTICIHMLRVNITCNQTNDQPDSSISPYTSALMFPLCRDCRSNLSRDTTQVDTTNKHMAHIKDPYTHTHIQKCRNCANLLRSFSGQIVVKSMINKIVIAFRNGRRQFTYERAKCLLYTLSVYYFARARKF